MSKNTTITALNLFDGMNLNSPVEWRLMNTAWDNEGMGFIEFCGWVHDMAEHINKVLADEAHAGFPGVYDYEVSCFLGTHIREFAIKTGRLPSQPEWEPQWRELHTAFFARGEGQ